MEVCPMVAGHYAQHPLVQSMPSRGPGLIRASITLLLMLWCHPLYIEIYIFNIVQFNLLNFYHLF